jgi:hypothetical protein
VLVTPALIAALKAATTAGSKWNPAALLDAHAASTLATTLAPVASDRTPRTLHVPAFMGVIVRLARLYGHYKT